MLKKIPGRGEKDSGIVVKKILGSRRKKIPGRVEIDSSFWGNLFNETRNLFQDDL